MGLEDKANESGEALSPKEVSVEIFASKMRRRYGIALGVVMALLVSLLVVVLVICFAPSALSVRCSISYKLPGCHKPDTLGNHSHWSDGTDPSLYDVNRTAEYMKLASESWDEAVEILHDPEHWKLDKGSNLNSGRVSSKTYKGLGRVSKLEGYVDCSPAELFKILVTDVEDLPKLDPTVKISEIVERVTDNIDVSYFQTRPIAGGLISERDYVNLRHWKEHDNTMVSALCATTHPDKPELKNIVRGVNKIGGILFRPVDGSPDRCLMEWVLGVDMKGHFPQFLLDVNLASNMMEMFSDIKEKVASELPNRTKLNTTTVMP